MLVPCQKELMSMTRYTVSHHVPLISLRAALIAPVDDAEGFILEHALISPPRTWPPLPPSTQQNRLTSNRRKMDWNESMKNNPDQPVVVPSKQDNPGEADDGDADGEGDRERCVVCLMGLRDRTIAGVCGHEFCVSTKDVYVGRAWTDGSLSALAFGRTNRGGVHCVLPTWLPFSCTT